jgi:chromosome partitioning protein
MSKTTRVFILRAPSADAVSKSLTEMLRLKLKVLAEAFDLKVVKKLPSPESAWYVILLSPELKACSQELNWVMDHHPDRVLPVLVRECKPGDIHPGLDFLTPFDFQTGSPAKLEALQREWQRNGIGRAWADSSVVMFLSLKGGVAKTTNLVAVAECLAEQGNRVLVVDTDHQCGASAVLLGDEQVDSLERRDRTLTDLFWESLNSDFVPDRIAHFAAPAISIKGIERCLSVIPGSLRLEDFWQHYRRTPKREAATNTEAFAFLRNTRRDQFSRWLRANYDYVLVDCPPAVAWQVRFFLLVADGYVVPTIPDRLSVRGARYLARRIQNIGASTRPVGLLWSMYRSQCTLHRQYVEGIHGEQDRMPWEDEAAPALPRPFAVTIPHGNDVIAKSLEPEAQPRSFADKYGTEFSKKYRDLTREIIGRLRRPTPAQRSVALAGAHSS